MLAPLSSKTAERRRLRKATDSEIYESILSAVIDQRLPPGTRLTEAELCSVYGTARRKVERVLIRLEAMGIVSIERNRGARVAQPSAQEARDVFALRRLVEAEVVRLVSGRLSPDARARIASSLETEHAHRQSGLTRDRIHHSGDFHILLAEECGNDEIRRLVYRLVARTSLITQLYGNNQALDCWHDEHVDLIELLDRGATEAAIDLMLRHLDSIEDALRLTEPGVDEPDLRAALLGGARKRTHDR